MRDVGLPSFGLFLFGFCLALTTSSLSSSTPPTSNSSFPHSAPPSSLSPPSFFLSRVWRNVRRSRFTATSSAFVWRRGGPSDFATLDNEPWRGTRRRFVCVELVSVEFCAVRRVPVAASHRGRQHGTGGKYHRQSGGVGRPSVELCHSVPGCWQYGAARHGRPYLQRLPQVGLLSRAPVHPPRRFM